jgi:hypothetical protein
LKKGKNAPNKCPIGHVQKDRKENSMKNKQLKMELKEAATGTIVALMIVMLVIILTFFCFGKRAFGTEIKTIAGSFVVDGYGIGEFAVKGPIEEKLVDEGKKIKERIGGRNGYLEIIIIGYSDYVGTTPVKDKTGRIRAEEAAAVLTPIFPPETKIISRSRGGVENVKQVKVEWKYVPAPAPIYLEIGILVGILVIVFIFAFLPDIMRKAKKKVKPEIHKPKVQWTDLAIDWIGDNQYWIKDLLDVKGKTYDIKIEIDGELFKSPFFSRNNKRIVVRADKIKFIKSLTDCLKKEGFAEQKKKLISEGTIVVR